MIKHFIEGKNHYKLLADAKLQFSEFDAEGNEIGIVTVVTAKNTCIYLEDDELQVDDIKVVGVK